MLRTMRDNLKSLSITLWLVIAAFIVSIFVVYGMQSAGPGAGRNPAVAATVNGEPIPWVEFQRDYRNRVETLRRIYGDRWNDDLVRQLNVDQQVLDGLITSRLLLQEAERYGLTVTREELAAAVMQDPVFADEGKFSRERYLGILEVNRLTPEQYEASVRQGLLQQKLATLVQASAKVSEVEAWDAFRAAKEKVHVVYVSLPRSDENKTRLEELRDRIGQKGVSWKTAMQDSGLKSQEPEPFTLGAAVVDPMDNRAFHLAILRLKEGETSPVVDGEKSYFLIHLVRREPATREAFEKEKEAWTRQLLSEKRWRIWTGWTEELKRRANIEIAEELT